VNHKDACLTCESVLSHQTHILAVGFMQNLLPNVGSLEVTDQVFKVHFWDQEPLLELIQVQGGLLVDVRICVYQSVLKSYAQCNKDYLWEWKYQYLNILYA
jgi:hypothetical protein